MRATVRPDAAAPFSRAEIVVDGLGAPPPSPAFQVRRSQADYTAPYLDIGGWTRTSTTMLPLDAWWEAGPRRLHLLLGGQLTRHIEPGPVKLRLPAAGAELDLFWPEEISVYDDGSLADHALLEPTPIRVVGVDVGAVPAAGLPAPDELGEQAAEVRTAPEPAPSLAPSSKPPARAGRAAERRSRRRSAAYVIGCLVVCTICAALVGQRWSSRHASPPGQDQPEPPARPQTVAEALQPVLGESSGRQAVRPDPGLLSQPASAIIARVADPESLVRYGAEKLARHEPMAADRLFEEAAKTRPGIPAPYAPALLARAFLHDPALLHDTGLPVPDAELAGELYRRAASGDTQTAQAARAALARLDAWRRRPS